MDPLQGAQDVIRCDICSDLEKSPAEVHCNTCHTNVCSPCVVKHMELDRSRKHDIVLFHSAKTDLILPNCSSHVKLKCELFCKECLIPVCLKCLSSDHNSHKVEEVTELCKSLVHEIENETDELESYIIPEYEKIMDNEGENLKTMLQKYDKFESSIEEHGKQVHRLVDIVIQKYKDRANQMMQADAKMLGQQKEEVTVLLCEAKQAARRNKAVVRSKNAAELMNHKSENSKLRNIPQSKSIIPPTFAPKPVSIELLESFFGTIPDSLVLFKQGYTLQTSDVSSTVSASTPAAIDRVVSSFPTFYKSLFRVSCTKFGKLWTSGNENTIKCLDMYTGSILDNAVLSLNPIDLCVTAAGDLFVCDGLGVIKREITGALHSYFDVPKGWGAEALTTSSYPNGALLVFLRREDNRQSKVVRVIDAIVRGEFQYDDKGREIYHTSCYDYFLTENRNGDVCVSDTTSLAVVDKSGKFRFKYHGNVFATFDKPFKPRGLATDTNGNILLTDLDNRCIHLIDENGVFIRYITCGGILDKVCDLCIDDQGKIWVAERRTAKVKCIEYH